MSTQVTVVMPLGGKNNRENPQKNRCCTSAYAKVIFVVIALIVLAGFVIALVCLYYGLRDDDGNASADDTSGSGDSVVSTSGQYQRAAVASDSKLCSESGAQILMNGGSAVDGAIATIFCLGVINCHSTGLGGGGFMVVHQNNDSENPVVIDFREVAPSDAYEKMYKNDKEGSQKGKLLVWVTTRYSICVTAACNNSHNINHIHCMFCCFSNK